MQAILSASINKLMVPENVLCFLLMTTVFVVELNKADQPKFRNVLVDIP